MFMGERCRDEQTLRDYGVCEPWIVQVRAGASMRPALGCRLLHSVADALAAESLRPCVAALPSHMTGQQHARRTQSHQKVCCDLLQVAGFTVNPEQPGKRFQDGVLVPCEG